MNYDTTNSSNSSNSELTLETNLENLKITSYKSDEESTSTGEDENIDIPELMDTEQIDHYGKRKIESDIQKDDYLRTFNKYFEKVKNTTRIFYNKIENIATNDVKPEYPEETSSQPIHQRIDDLNKRNVAQ
ncbi:hypothetical protein Goklo_020514 [Gossypium klotzschianum]|uniref:Uncharacterized protein n=1 Tax=Gossypium klotzschianum TaxID=34286 RepID=A0A7J8USH1_9ROSI|nr:hypothetical protein [Gossypium klotzschianum]